MRTLFYHPFNRHHHCHSKEFIQEEMVSTVEKQSSFENKEENQPLKIDQAGIKLIADFEGFRPSIYLDVTGNPTIGYGHLITTNDQNRLAQGISQEEALTLLRQDVEIAENTVQKLVQVPLNQNQLNALVSFVFNVGTSNFRSSTLLRELNQGHYEKVPSELSRWNRSKGKVIMGLINRRAAEAKLFAAPSSLTNHSL